jgi:tRNA pseudouridine38-40 synthase
MPHNQPRNLKLTLAYDGADYSGWQVQPGRATIQGTLAEAILRITDEESLPQGSGRTDAGVHALAQVATVVLRSSIPRRGLQIALNDTLPPAIRVIAVEEVAAEFHARKSAKAKTYRYRIYRGDVCPPFLARYVYHHPYLLDEPTMMAAASEVVGEHDFTSFAAVDPEEHRADSPAGESKASRSATAADSGIRTNIRTIFASEWRREGDEFIYQVQGSGFLHHMVRNLVGAFLLVGKGTLRPDDLTRIIAARNRSANPAATAPAGGLYLVNVEY